MKVENVILLDTKDSLGSPHKWIDDPMRDSHKYETVIFRNTPAIGMNTLAVLCRGGFYREYQKLKRALS